MNCYIGLDVGGTKMHGVLVRGSRVLARVRRLHGEKSRKEILRTLVDFIRELREKSRGCRVRGVGVGVPGIVNATKTTILSATNFPALKGLNLAAYIKKATGLRVKLENDAKCFVLGAKTRFTFHVSRSKIFVGLTLGTGLGGGIRVGNTLWEGAHRIAGEFGHMVIVAGGEQCSCGKRGCLEMYASGKFLVREGKKSPLELENLARKGNREARRVYEKFGYYLGIGISNIVYSIDPDVVILGGSIAKASDLFLPTMKKTLVAHKVSHAFGCEIPVLVASNLDDAGAVGAAMLFKTSL